MRLTELEPEFVRWSPTGWSRGHTIADAQGLLLHCPKHFVENKGLVGTHSILVWSRSAGVPDDARPGPARWKLLGTGFHDLTLQSDLVGEERHSVDAGDGCHFTLTDGEVTLHTE